MTLPRKQLRLLTFVNASFIQNGFAPSHGEMAQGVGVSRSGIHRMLHELERKGYIQRQQGCIRNIQVIQTPVSEQDTRANGNMDAAVPLEASESASSSISANHQADLIIAMLGSLHHFKLTVADDMMIGKGILRGDVAILRRRQYVSNGSMAAVVYEGKQDLRQIFRIRDMFLLKAANERSVQHLLSSDQFEIRGELVTLLRRCSIGGAEVAF